MWNDLKTDARELIEDLREENYHTSEIRHEVRQMIINDHTEAVHGYAEQNGMDFDEALTDIMGIVL